MNALFPLELLSRTTPLESLLLLLLAGHLLGDFLFQTRWMVERKKELRILLAHAGAVTVAHILALAPFTSLPVLGTLAGVGAVHLGIDWIKPHWRWDRPGPLALFFLDQLAHLVVLAGAYLVLLRLGPPPVHLDADALRIWTLAGIGIATLAVAWTGGSVVVQMTLDSLGPGNEESGGELVGKVERMIFLVLIVLGEWIALAVVVAGKSVVGLRSRSERASATRWVAGTFTSLLVAVILGLGFRALL